MSLLDFDDDAGVRTTTTTTTTTLNGHTSIDDPFGFGVFGTTGSTGTKTTTAVETSYSAGHANADNFFDDFDPLTTFGNTSNKYEVTHTTEVDTSRQSNKDEFDLFPAYDSSSAPPQNYSTTTTTTTSRSWVNDDDDDDFEASNTVNIAVDLVQDFSHSAPKNETPEFKKDSPWKHEEEEEEEKEFDQNRFNLNNEDDEPREGEVTTERVEDEEEEEEEDSRSNQFSEDFMDRSRGRINLEEIRQRSYEDLGPVSSSSYVQNRKEQKIPEKSSSVIYVLGAAAAADNMCKICAKRVYEMEKVTADCQVYHKSCFRCNHCNRVLGLGNFAANDGRLYCKPHFIEIFKTKGNYKDSFALAEQLKHQTEDISKNEDQDQEDGGHQRRFSNDNVIPRNRSSLADCRDDDADRDSDEYDAEMTRQINAKEEIPVIQIKSVRSIFEKKSQDVSQPLQQQKKTTTASAPVSTESRRPDVEPVGHIRSDSEKSDLERERRKSVERKDSGGDREIIHSSTTSIVEDELPPPSFTKSMLAKFRLIEDGSIKTSAAFGKSGAAKQPPSVPRHQTLSYRSSADSQGSNDAVVKESRSDRVAVDMISRSESQDSKGEEHKDELPQAGLAKSLLAQWRNLEEQSKRGRGRDLKKTSDARRSQSMSRVETVQRARLYPNTASRSGRSKEEEDRRPESHSDQEASADDDDLSTSIPTRQHLAKFKEMEGGFQHGSKNIPPAKKKKVPTATLR